MDRNPGNPKIFFLQHSDENIDEMKIPRHKWHEVFERAPVHESIRNITVSNPDPGCHKSGKSNKARYANSSPAVVSGFSVAVNNFILRSLVQKSFKINRVASMISGPMPSPYATVIGTVGIR